MDDSRELKELSQSVLEAFRDWPMPPEVAAELSAVQHHDEKADIYRVLQHKDSKDARRDASFGALPLLSDRVFSYFLPSFLRGALENDDGDFILNLVNRIAPPWPKGKPPRIHLELRWFSEQQLAVVRRILLFLRDYSFERYPRVQRRIDRMAPHISRDWVDENPYKAPQAPEQKTPQRWAAARTWFVLVAFPLFGILMAVLATPADPVSLQIGLVVALILATIADGLFLLVLWLTR